MFASDDGTPLDRWSQAKYSLEVFAAMLDTGDALQVYRTSDFDDDGRGEVAVTLLGAEPASSRVAKIHRMQLQGGGTPYAPVTRAYHDLVAAESSTKWLVILSDGAFDDRSSAQVQRDFRTFASDNSDESSALQVAFLAIGPDAPQLTNEPDSGVYVDQARASDQLLGKMTEFSNRIFERNLLTHEQGRVAPDIPLSELTVFAQGEDVAIGELEIGGEVITPASTVEVSWSQNKAARYGSKTTPATPNTRLKGKLATYLHVPAGTGAVKVGGAQAVDMYYKPDVGFGVQLQDADGLPVDPSKIVGGDYTLYYGFMDDTCTFLSSPLLGDVDYSARVLRDGEVIADAFQSGDTITLTRGAVELDVTARYLGGNTARSVIDVTVLQAARPTSFDVSERSFAASELGATSAPDDAIRLTYGLGSSGELAAFSPEEWSSVTPESFTVTSDSNITFDVVVADEIGIVYLVPHAPQGDVLTADTGRIPVSVTVEHSYDEQLYRATTTLDLDIVDDISWWERFANWFATVGWWLALLVLLALVLLGYVVKPRFSRKMRPAPSISMRPLRATVRGGTAQGSFRRDRVISLLPYLSERGELVYVGTSARSQFPALKLKAKRGRRAEVVNWQALVAQENVQIGGRTIDATTKRPPLIGPTTTIVATIRNNVRFEMTPSS